MQRPFPSQGSSAHSFTSVTGKDEWFHYTSALCTRSRLGPGGPRLARLHSRRWAGAQSSGAKGSQRRGSSLDGPRAVVSINKRISCILALFTKTSVPCRVCPEMMTDRATGASAVRVRASLSSTGAILTDAVGLQCTEPEPWLALTGVAGLHGNTPPRAAYGRSGSALVIN